MKDELIKIKEDALKEIASAGDSGLLEKARVKYLGRKGIITELFKKMADLPKAERSETGQMINGLKKAVTEAFDERSLAVSKTVEEKTGRVDITLPGIRAEIGRVHPITKTLEEILSVFISLGFRVVEGPEIETEYYNFEALNIPLDHPSRDAFDTFYLENARNQNLTRPGEIYRRARVTRNQSSLLRSHTSPVQARFMEKHKPPFAIVIPGKVYRPDATDASHSFMFHQVEGLVVGEDIHFSDLKGSLAVFAKQIFGEKTKTRFRPSFFPFTEPSAEVDVSCIICQGASNKLQTTNYKLRKCSVCGGKGWLEILGAGMVNPKVFKNVGYDPEKWTGFAFGMGVERIAMLKYGINDIRLFFENDVRFLRQF